LVVKTLFLVARAKKQAPKTKRAGRKLSSTSLFVSAKRRGGKGISGLKRRKPALGKGRSPPFLARRRLFCSGMVLLGNRGSSLFGEPTENTSFSKRNSIFFSTKLEMIFLN